jgi:hypothetical protein
MTKESAKHAHAILSLYAKLYFEKYNKRTTINRYREKWGAEQVIEDLGYDQARKVMEYYFKTSNSGHALTWFFYNYDRLNEMMIKIEEDAVRRARIREETRMMVEAKEHNEL